MKKGFTNRRGWGIIGVAFGPVAQLGERTVRIREVRGFDPLQVHQIENHLSENWGDFLFDHRNTTDGFQKIFGRQIVFGPPSLVLLAYTLPA